MWPRPGKLDAAEEARFRLVDVAAKAGITRVLLAGRPDKDHLLDSSGGGAAFLDYDRDGRLDVYLVNGWRLEGSQVVEKGRNALYHGKIERWRAQCSRIVGASNTFSSDYTRLCGLEP